MKNQKKGEKMKKILLIILLTISFTDIVNANEYSDITEDIETRYKWYKEILLPGDYYPLKDIHYDDKIDENYDTKTEVAKIRNRAVEFKIKKNQKIIRFVAIKQFKNFLAKPEGKLRLGVVTHITSKKKHK